MSLSGESTGDAGGGPVLFGASLGRTGTQSLAAALEALGIQPYGMKQVLTLPGHTEIWNQALTGEALPEWDAVFKGYGATIGWPMCFFAPELAKAYPKAKFLMMGRDAESWYASVAKSWVVLSQLRRFRFIPRVRGTLSVIEPIMERVGGMPPDRDQGIAAYHAHAERVRAAIPAGRILDYEITQGWAPLCEALGVPVPDKPFPRTNVAGGSLKQVVTQLIRG